MRIFYLSLIISMFEFGVLNLVSGQLESSIICFIIMTICVIFYKINFPDKKNIKKLRPLAKNCKLEKRNFNNGIKEVICDSKGKILGVTLKQYKKDFREKEKKVKWKYFI